ncbi:MAG: hypothetical protein DID90_2727554677 [Candidatus Nitrotoga sp. LAW]|nr:MAG: hypothetical protein DID90_2727554677 [Candidatus Nitrotoga sp. LAW]
MENIKKLCAGIGVAGLLRSKNPQPHARFGEGGLTKTLSSTLLIYFPVAEENCNSEFG